MRSPRPSGELSNSEPEARLRHASGTPVRRAAWRVWSQLILTSTVASACTTTRVQTAPVPDQVRVGQRGEVRLTTRSGEVVTMFDARVAGDSIIGFARPAGLQPSQRLAVARADVQSVAATELSVGKTIAAAVLGGLATLTLLVAVCVASV